MSACAFSLLGLREVSSKSGSGSMTLTPSVHILFPTGVQAGLQAAPAVGRGTGLP